MSMLRPLDPSEHPSSENDIYGGRSSRNGLPGTINTLNKMRVLYKPELGGIAISSHTYHDSSPAGLDPRVTQLLSKGSLPDVERQAIFRQAKQHNHSSPISPLSPMDSVGISDSSCHSAGSYHQYTNNNALFHSQGFSYNPPTLAEVLVSSGGQYPSMPIVQSSASLQKSVSSDNLTGEHTSGYLNFPSSDCQRGAIHGSIFDENPEYIRQWLQELERELFSDIDEASIISPAQSTYIDREWADTIENLLYEDSPMHSPMESTTLKDYSNGSIDYSSVANISDACSVSQTNSLQQEAYASTGHQQDNVYTGSSSKQLLVQCATAISEGKLELASHIIAKLRETVSIQGDPMERLAAYMVEGLAARIASSGKGLYKALNCKEPPSIDTLSAMQILFEVCPYFKFGCMVANGAICEAFKDEQKVHILDFEVGQGSQYIILLKALAERPGGPPHLRITAVDDPEDVRHIVGGLGIVGMRLEQYAKSFGASLQFTSITEKVGDVQPWMLKINPDEVLAVNFAFQLHHMPDESVSTKNPRDRLLRMVKSLNPKVVTVVEQEVNTNTAPFLPRFMEALNYYSSVFESLDATLKRDSTDRMNVEKQCLARDIVNIIACEGEERIERYEVAGKWRARMTMAGFSVYPLSANVKDTVKSLLCQSYCNSYKTKEEGGAMYFGWLDRILIAASAWH